MRTFFVWTFFGHVMRRDENRHNEKSDEYERRQITLEEVDLRKDGWA
jgi:hypothetical protein